MTAEIACDRLAAQQYGVISRAQALEAGMTRGAVDQCVKSGRWRLLHRGVYVPRPVPDSWHQRLLAAVFCGGSRTLASHRSAAKLWALDGIEERVIEISVSSGRRIRGAVVHRRPVDDDPLATAIGGIPVTGLERTIIDLASVMSEKRTGLALDEALRSKLTTLQNMDKALKALGSRGRVGTATLWRLLELRDERDALTESRLEASFLKMLRAHGLPEPVPQHPIAEGGRVIARLDFAYPSVRIGIETDGYRWHGGRERWARDMRRENRLKLLGWTILRFSWDDMRRRPQIVADQIEAALEGTHLIHPRISGVVETS